MAALVVLAGAFVAREDIAAWYVGYRFVWAPERLQLGGRRGMSSNGELLVNEDESAMPPRGGIWSVRSARVTFIDPPPGGEWRVHPAAINDRLVVVGELLPVDGDLPNRPFVWQPEGGMQMLASPGKGDTWFSDLNDHDQAVGGFDVARSEPLILGEKRAFRWSQLDGFQALAHLTEQGWVSSNATSLNEAGWIAGESVAEDGDRHPVMWLPPEYRPRDLGLPENYNGGVVVDLNEEGVGLVNVWSGGGFLVGWAYFLWTDERGLSALPVPDGRWSVAGLGLSKDGTVLLDRDLGGREEAQRLLFRDGSLHELPGPRAGLTVEYTGLSASGSLIGSAGRSLDARLRRGFVAVPVR